MPREFQVRRDQVLPCPPERVWRAVATGEGNAGWLYPMEIEPGTGGAVSRGSSTVVEWQPPHRFACRTPDQDGFTNTLSYAVDAGDDGTSLLSMGIHWVHTGTPDDGWDTRADAAERHVDFYQHSLSEYLRHFDGRPAGYVKASRPGPPSSPDAFSAVRDRLGVPGTATAGDTVKVTLPDTPGGPVEAHVDYTDADFLGLRTPDALYRFYNGSAWKWPLWVGHHLFAADADVEAATRDWDMWLAESAP
ncbi:SRPBCC domain-containing protein [Streptomyces sp. NBC_00466]|uniref:SRPBCC domain-containing protein n=1 Tax=Streptomyces sp. NBC_00466 TaxID=2903655 RepID=UPI0030E14C0B